MSSPSQQFLQNRWDGCEISSPCRRGPCELDSKWLSSKSAMPVLSCRCGGHRILEWDSQRACRHNDNGTACGAVVISNRVRGENEIRARGTEWPVRRFSKPVVSATHPPLQKTVQFSRDCKDTKDFLIYNTNQNNVPLAKFLQNINHAYCHSLPSLFWNYCLCSGCNHNEKRKWNSGS